ncbi:hypothetical protein NDU88_001561 [Pleurodeles waltl]|uniref:Uncharacterized protein n=1 Tax=Pleurodeles waltl TaxID=8319 RepID=A0AAV7WMT7_PLEWA|nr:hypothetical protein NDU88_001561 [Pleurodeles waltl]
MAGLRREPLQTRAKLRYCFPAAMRDASSLLLRGVIEVSRVRELYVKPQVLYEENDEENSATTVVISNLAQYVSIIPTEKFVINYTDGFFI